MNRKLKIHLKIAKKALGVLKYIIFIVLVMWAQKEMLDFLYHDLGLSLKATVLVMIGILSLGGIIAIWYNAYKYYDKYGN